ETDADGRVRIEDVPIGVAHVVILAEGYGRHDAYVDIGGVEADLGSVFVVPDAELTYRTTVRQPAPGGESSATSRVLSDEEIRTVPGTQGDPLRALQNL